MASSIEYRRVRHSDPGLESVSRSVDEVVARLKSVPIISGQLLTDVQLQESASNKIQHRLGRKVKGVLVVAPSAAGGGRARPSADSSEIVLSSSAKLKVSLWVF